jgi:Cell division protein 48 (CDC48), N-terminal domain.
MSEITLKIAEAAQRHVGKGIAVVDPKVVEENGWETGQILELVGNRKSHVNSGRVLHQIMELE